MTLLVDDGTRLHVETRGDGPPVLLLSGGPGCVQYLDGERVVPRGYRLVAPGPRGVLPSEGAPHDLARAIADLEQTRTWAGVDRWQVVGHSWGADLALAYAEAHPGSVEHVVSCCGTGIQDDRSWKAAYDAGAASEPPVDVAFDAAVHATLLASWRRWTKAPDLLARLSRLEVPVTFVLAGDDIRPSWPVEQLAGLLPRTRLVRVDGVPHDFWATHPDRWRAALEEALAEAPASSTGP